MTNTAQHKNLYIKTWGCQMNVYDSQRMADVLKPMGYHQTEELAEADMVILNTCHIREKATEKVFSELGRIKKNLEKTKDQRDGRMPTIGVAGCVAQAEGDVITTRAPYVDLVFGPQTYHKLPEMVNEVTGELNTRVINTDFPAEAKFDYLPEEMQNPGPVAYLSVQEGCDKFCTFCVVPYTRGAEYSRSVESIIRDAKALVAHGAREIQLLGQNVNAYHGEGPNGQEWGLAALIKEIAARVDGLERLRYTTSHPRDMDDELIQTHGEVDILMPFLHLPVQSGSDSILKAMNRRHTHAEYRDIIDRLRIARPDLAFSSDFIIGFPGETEQDHKDTLDLIEHVGYASAYSFVYSPRPGTPGAVMTDQIQPAIKSRRLQEVQALLNQQQHQYNESFTGQTLDILFDRIGQKDNQLIGRSPYMHSVYVHANERLKGEILPVKITHGGPNSLTGDLIQFDSDKPIAA